MDEPGAGLRVCVDDDVDSLARCYQHGILDVVEIDGRGVAGDDLLIVPVRVHGMELFARDVDPANAKSLAAMDVERARRRVLFAVKGEVVLCGALNLP